MVNLSVFNLFSPSANPSSEIVELRIYPIKSCRGISLRSWTVTEQGLDLDRRWMFVDVKRGNEFQTIRQNPKFTLIDTALACSADHDNNVSENGLELIITIRGRPGASVSVPAKPTRSWLEENTFHTEVDIWEHKTDAYMYKDGVNRIFSDFLEKPVALVYKGPQKRKLGANGLPKYLGRVQDISFPDIMPVLIVNNASLVELNDRLKAKGQKEITIERFRPNIVLRGGEQYGMAAWSEDNWKTLRLSNTDTQRTVSSIDFDVPMRCARCQVPNVDPETAEKDKHEPWDTLVSYRRIDEGIKFKPCFGMMLAPRSEGPIRTGMNIQVLETTQDHKFVKA